MNKYSRKILRIINEANTPTNFYLYENLKYDKNTIDHSLELLKDDNYIYCEFSRTGKIYYYSTVKGKDYILNRVKNSFIYILKIIFLNIICPLFVAYITTIITIDNSNCCKDTNNNGETYSINP